MRMAALMLEKDIVDPAKSLLMYFTRHRRPACTSQRRLTWCEPGIREWGTRSL